jgi:predicted RNase H-like HicB family nuclease
VSAGKKADEYSVDYVLLADDYFAYLATNQIQVAGGELEGRFRTHLIILSGESSRSLGKADLGDGRRGRSIVGIAKIVLQWNIRIQVDQLPEGLYLATSDELPGLVAQGRTIAEALDIARDVARKLIEARRGRESEISFHAASTGKDYTIVVAA